MTKKKNISKEDIKTWQDYLKNPKDIIDKDKTITAKKTINQRFKFDLHGFSLNDANEKVKELIPLCVKKGFKEILFITGKGLHSKVEENTYVSKDLSKLRYSVPEYIQSSPELEKYVSNISNASKIDGGDGAIIIKLKKL